MTDTPGETGPDRADGYVNDADATPDGGVRDPESVPAVPDSPDSESPEDRDAGGTVSNWITARAGRSTGSGRVGRF